MLVSVVLRGLIASSLEINVTRWNETLQLGPYPITEYRLSGNRSLFEVRLV